MGEWDRLRYAGDPDISAPPLQMLLSQKYFAGEAQRIDPKRARPFVAPGVTGSEGNNTTHFVVADRWETW